MVEAVLHECPLYFELEEIFADNAAINPPFTRVSGALDSEGIEIEDVEDVLPTIPEQHEQRSSPTPFPWEATPLPSRNAASQSSQTRSEELSPHGSPSRRPAATAERSTQQPSRHASASATGPQSESESSSDDSPTRRQAAAAGRSRQRSQQAPPRRSSNTGTRLPTVARRPQRRGTNITDEDVLQDTSRAPAARRRGENGAVDSVVAMMEQQREISAKREEEKTKRHLAQIDADREIKLGRMEIEKMQLQLERDKFEMERENRDRRRRRRDDSQ
jgi:hypothetical protein